MKNSKLFISVCMVLVLAFLSACGEDKDIRTAIPSDAQIVVAADWNALAKKGGLSDPEVSASVNEFVMKQVPEDSKAYVEEVLKDPGETGIGFEQKLYVFVNDKSDMGVVVKVDSKRKFKKLLGHVNAGWKNKEWQNEDGIEYLQADDEAIMLDGDMAIYIRTNSELTDEAIRMRGITWLKQKAEDSFTATKGCAAFEKETGDITLWCTLDALVRDESEVYVRNSLPRDVDLKDLQCLVGLRFENGCVEQDAKVLSASEAATKLYEQRSSVLKGMEGTFVPDVSSKPWLWMGTSIRGRQLCRQLEQNEELWQMLDGATFGFNLRKLLASVDGDMALTVCRSNVVPSSESTLLAALPLFAVQAELDNDSILEDMDAMAQMLNLLDINMKKDGPGRYSIQQLDIPMWLGVDGGKRFFYATDVDLLKPAGNAPEWASEVRGSLFYMRMDIRQMRFTPSSAGMFLPFLNLFDVLVVKSEDVKNVKMQLWATDRKENVLKQLLTTIGNTYGKN